MSRLIIRQEAGVEGFRFVVDQVRPGGVRSAPPVEIENPFVLALEETQFMLGDELAWYLERYLDYPFGFEGRAARVVAALRGWGSRAFETLFGDGQARDFYRDATSSGHEELQLAIVGADATVLSWPWEALHDPLLGGDLAHHCRIERQLDRIADPPPLHPQLSRDRIGILLVSPRPFDRDIEYRSVSRPLVTMIEGRRLPADIKLLRPPTLAALRAELAAGPGAYHIVHFDGHGGFGAGGGGHAAPQGMLAFEDAEGKPDFVTASQLSQLLREHRIPIAVLNACQSAMLGKGSGDAFASVATALLRSGVRSVVAMGYSLYVSAAQQFLPDFYERLFATGEVADAVRWGRKALFAQPKRSYDYPLDDWLVPVLYQQEPMDLAFATTARVDHPSALDTKIPDAARLTPQNAPHGLIGRDSAILALERASRRPPAGLLIHGLGGIGKTTLARGYIEWLAQTQGLPAAVIWLSFEDIRSAEFVLNRLVEALFGAEAMAAPDESKWPALRKALRAAPILMVWDNFESASGAADAGAVGAMPEGDRLRLKQWLEDLRGGATRILITSRSDEAWLGITGCYRVPIGGLQGEERQALTRAILADLGVPFDPKNRAIADLVDDLEGHALMMRAILPRLAKEDPGRLKAHLDSYAPTGESTDPIEQKLYATLRYVEDGLPPALKPILYPLSLHIGHADTVVLDRMAKLAKHPLTPGEIESALERLEAAGLVQGTGHTVYRLHPALTRYLRTRAGTFGPAKLARRWDKVFVTVMAELADMYAPKSLLDQRALAAFFGASIEAARVRAEKATGYNEYGALTQFLAAYAQNLRNLPLAQRYYRELAELCEKHGLDRFAASAYHQLGRVAEERHDLAGAENWFLKSLEIKERLSKEGSAAGTYHELGVVAQTRRDFDAAEGWYKKALEIELKFNDKRGLADTYHQLGIVAHERGTLDDAESWYHKSLEIEVEFQHELGIAGSYHQLGAVAQDRKDYDAAEDYFRKSLEIKERLDEEHSASTTYHHLGILEQIRSNFELAERLYLKSIEIKGKYDDDHGAASTYYQLGTMAFDRGDSASAELWCRKALEIFEKLGSDHNAGIARSFLQYLTTQTRDPSRRGDEDGSG